MPNPSLPGGANGQAQVAYVMLYHGLEKTGTPTGSNALTIAATDTSLTFEVDAESVANNTPAVGTGKLAGYVPLRLRMQLFDNDTAVIGRWASSLQGDANTTTNWKRIPTTGIEIDCYELFAKNATIYVRVEAALSGTGRLDYALRCAREG